MSVISIPSSLPPMSKDNMQLAYKVEEYIKDNLEPVVCCTQHTIHSGIYTRTVFIPKNTLMVGAVIKPNTTLVLSGKLVLYIGDDTIHIDGYNVITALGDRKQVAYAIEDSYATLMFNTSAKTVEEAEVEMTDDYNSLISRLDTSFNLINITGV